MSVSPKNSATHLDVRVETDSPSRHLTTNDLREFLTAQLRSTERAISRSEFRHRALDHGFSGSLVEGIYRLLVTLERRGHAQRVASRGRWVYWVNDTTAARHPAAAIERSIS